MCYTVHIAIVSAGRGGMTQRQQSDELREFMVILRRALLLIVRYIEKRYNLASAE